ncbi:amino acid ABC transporter ATP-binding protein [Sphaerisporangium sp. NPDC051011]|uniref:amino acid ABC transporter ATP-binding protein n=1 Tax=Sphaerisporangium sp. NPDC051011 TaxID=3155792 RepID=UPI0033EF82C3
MADHVIRAVNLSKKFGDDLVIDNVTLEVEQGQTVCIMGPSGAGKTSLLRCLNHLEKPSAGSVFIDGEMLGYEHKGDHLLELPKRKIAYQRRQVGMVFQSFNLFQHMTVIQNVMEAPVGVLKLDKREARERAEELLATVGLAHKADAMPHQLSGGQQQRVAIARALAMRPKVMLYDEPTSALDPELVKEVLDTMRKLAESGMTMIVVTHEIAFAREAAARAVFMEQGRIVEDGSVDQVFNNSSNPRIRDFLGHVLA